MLRRLTILVVDDEWDFLNNIAEYIRTLGHTVVAETGAIDALDTLCGQSFDLLISDVRLKGMDGLELARMARKQQPDIAIIIMTAYDDEYPLSAALRAGADGYMNKPFSLKTLNLIFEKAYWNTLSRMDWWEARTVQ